MPQPKFSTPAKGTSKPASSGAPAKGAQSSVEAKPSGGATGRPLVVTHEEIAQRAYLKWMTRGGEAHANWTEAEAELRAEAARG